MAGGALVLPTDFFGEAFFAGDVFRVGFFGAVFLAGGFLFLPADFFGGAFLSAVFFVDLTFFAFGSGEASDEDSSDEESVDELVDVVSDPSSEI